MKKQHLHAAADRLQALDDRAVRLGMYIAEHQADTLLMLGDIALFADAQEEEAGN